MELSEIHLKNAEQQDFNGKYKDEYTIKTILIQNSTTITKKRKLDNIPYIIYQTILVFLIFLISLIIYLILLSKYNIKYIYEDNAYNKPKYSSHNYSSITFNNGLKVVLIQVDPDDEAGGVISFDFEYLENKYSPGYIELAFHSLINNNIFNSNFLTNYFGTFNCKVEKFYSSFYFQILGGGFKSYLKTFSELTYLKDDDERFNNIGNQDFIFNNNHDERKNHLLEYLIYGFNNSEGKDIIPEDYNEIIKDFNGNYTEIKKIMHIILNDPSKIRIVLYSHYKMSLMKKMFLKYFNNIIHKQKIDDQNLNRTNAYNLSVFSTKKIIYFKSNDFEDNSIEINYFLKNENINYNQLIKDSQYLSFIIYILNQTEEGSLYYELNHINNETSIKSLSSDYEIILKNKIKFSIDVKLNYYSYHYIPDIIMKIYNYMNNIKLYINCYNYTFNDTRMEELQTISEQNFTFMEDAHESIYFINIAFDLFYKDERNFLLKQMWFSKQNFIDNIAKVQYYFKPINI